MEKFVFKKAVPVWKKGDVLTKNISLDFTTKINSGENVKLYLAASTSFEVFVNENFVCHGPARCAHDYYKVEELLLDKLLTKQENFVRIRVVGYNQDSYCYLNKPSFICAEIVENQNVLVATGTNFNAAVTLDRVQKVPRYSKQRPSCEVFKFDEAVNMNFPKENVKAVELEVCEEKNFLKRDVLQSEYKKITPKKFIDTGSFTTHEVEEWVKTNPAFLLYSERSGFEMNELECLPLEEYSQLSFTSESKNVGNLSELSLASNTYATVDIGANHVGILSAELEFEADGTLYVFFDEVLTDGKLDWKRWSNEVINVLVIKAKKGKYRFVGAEPYTMRYLQFCAKDCAVKVNGFGLLEVAYPESNIKVSYCGEDAELKKIYDAALLSFRSNVLDIYMDCPSRERAGWLCDSFFMANTERVLTGETRVGKAFINNFLLIEKHERLDERMIASCYPGDVSGTGGFIPNWAMWFVLQVYQHCEKCGDDETKQRAKKKIYGLVEYFKEFENEFGLLESLAGWVFVEWSFANKLTKDVSYPSNMLYSAFKRAVGEMYGDDKLKAEGEALMGTIRKMSLLENGFFCDNAIRTEEGLKLSGQITEVCQYYAFYFGIATLESDAKLWETLLADFGAKRMETQKYPEVHFANAFIGYYLRLELLLLFGHREQLISDIKDCFLDMAEKTGTLWEHNKISASCNHGFASYVIYWLKELGLVK